MSMKTNHKVKSKINNHIKKFLYNWIMHHPQVFLSPIFNDGLNANIDGHTRPQIVPKLLLQVYIRELHNSLVSDSDYILLKDSRNAYNNIIISISTLCSLLPPQLKNSERHKVMCGCECCIYVKSIHSLLLSWRDRYFKKFKDQSQNAQNRISVEESNCLYETYKNTFMPHG